MGSVLVVQKKRATCKNFELSKRLILVIKTSKNKKLKLLWHLVDLYWPFWELEMFTCNLLFTFWRCLLCSYFKQWSAKKQIWKEMIERSTFRVSNSDRFLFHWIFRTFWQTSGSKLYIWSQLSNQNVLLSSASHLSSITTSNSNPKSITIFACSI